MTQFSRGHFLRSSAKMAAALGMSGVPAPAAASWQTPPRSRLSADMVLVNGRIYTVDATVPRAEAFAVAGDRFVAVGRSEDIRNLVGPRTVVIDAKGMTVTPGFIDAHCHPGEGVQRFTEVNLAVRTIAAVQQALQARANDAPPGAWILGGMFDDARIDARQPLTRRALDAAVPNHPVRINHSAGHVAWYNSKAFELAGITAETRDPDMGTYERVNGELTGRVLEHGRDAINALIPNTVTPARFQQAVHEIMNEMVTNGLTSLHDPGCGLEMVTAYQDASRSGDLPLRVYFFVRQPLLQHLASAGILGGFGDDRLRLGGAKFTADGAASARTMRMSAPYIGRPDDYGTLAMSQAAIHDAVEDAHRHGFQIAIHANGDVAIDMVLAAYERVQERWPRPDARHRIEHCTLVNPRLLARIKAAGAVPTPFSTFLYVHGDKWDAYGEDRMRSMFAVRSFLDSGIPAAGGSDYNSGPYEPLMAIQTMVTRRDSGGRVWGENQRVTVDDALRAMTLNGAHASFDERKKGSIVAGKLADFVVLAEDPHDVEPTRIKDIKVMRTVVGGRTVHALDA